MANETVPLAPVADGGVPPPPVAGAPSRILGLNRAHLSGYVFGILTALCWGTSPIFVRKGLDRFPFPLWGVTIGLSAASLAYLAWTAVRRPKPPLRLRPWRDVPRAMRVGLVFMLAAGLASALGATGRTFAIDLAPVVVVAPLFQTTTLWTIIVAPLVLGRQVERITPKLLLGALLVTAGAALVVLGQR